MWLREHITKLPWVTFAKLLCLIALLIAANYLAYSIADILNFKVGPDNKEAVHRTVLVSAVLYTVLLAIPFVPGAEVGWALIAMLGPPVAFLVYICTVAGLSLSFVAGRLIPLPGLIRLSENIKLVRLSALLREIEPLGVEERLAFLANRTPNRYLPFLLRHRYLALAVAVNVPGNFLIGGGGGIALFAGISRVYSIPGFLATIILSVAPIPVAVYFFGSDFLMT
jgi:hypothetical protein